jgi:hypothetical protein
MPRRKSLLAQMYVAHQKAKLQRQREEERARKEWLAEERRIATQLEKEAAQQRREEERAAQAKLREDQQAERARQQAAAKAERLAAQQEHERERQAAAELRENQRREAEEWREQQRREADRRRRVAERRIAEADVRTEAVRAKVAAFERLLLDRNRHLAVRSRRAEDAFNARGRKRSWKRSSGRWLPRFTQRVWTAHARRSKYPSPPSYGSSMSCRARRWYPR